MMTSMTATSVSMCATNAESSDLPNVNRRTVRIAAVVMWPMAQLALIRLVFRRLPLRVIRFDTATRWSAS